MNDNLIKYTLHLADNSLILGQRNSEWCGHGPVLEQDIAITNISLDLIGQARNFYQYAAQLINESQKAEGSSPSPLERELEGEVLQKEHFIFVPHANRISHRWARHFRNMAQLLFRKSE